MWRAPFWKQERLLRSKEERLLRWSIECGFLFRFVRPVTMINHTSSYFVTFIRQKQCTSMEIWQFFFYVNIENLNIYHEKHIKTLIRHSKYFDTKWQLRLENERKKKWFTSYSRICRSPNNSFHPNNLRWIIFVAPTNRLLFPNTERNSREIGTK